jgi:adenine-specific DNA-methyltransferase
MKIALLPNLTRKNALSVSLDVCKHLDELNAKDGKFLLSYIIDVDGFHNENIENWVNREGYVIIPVENTQGRYNNRREVIIKNY